MTSILPGYEYDIFVSYRQKDNKGERWVSEFVDALKTELESTFKEDISVYFDINPHDGLLETHDVDDSLKEKLKCLVFIPIISRTYCDPKSFAWEHEFSTFVENASKDQFGLKVKLPNGNVANRVLPVRIHNLDTVDIKLCESLLGGVLRGVEFIYRSPGVNRPLRSEEDKPHDNLNNTIYCDQINKTANAIKEIVSGLRSGEVVSSKERTEPAMPWEDVGKVKKLIRQAKQYRLDKLKLLSGIMSILILLVLVGIILYPKIFQRDSLRKLRASDGRIHIAMMPFQNMSNDSTLNYLKEWIPESVTSYLSNYPEDLQVRQTESIYSIIKNQGLTNNASITPNVAALISQKLDANIFISGSLTKTGTGIIVNAKLMNSKTEEVIKSFEIPGSSEEISPIIDTLSRKIKDYLIISKLKKELNPEVQHYASTSSPDALRNFIMGQNAIFNNDFLMSAEAYGQAIKIDSNFTEAYIGLINSYRSHILVYNKDPDLDDSSRKLCLRIYNRRDKMPPLLKIRTEYVYSSLFETPYDCVNHLRQLLELDDQQPRVYRNLGAIFDGYFREYDKAIPEYEKSLEILNKWGKIPESVYYYTVLGSCYRATKQYNKERKLYKKAEQDFPDNFDITYNQAILSLNVDDTVVASRYLDKLMSIEKKFAAPETIIITNLAEIYTAAGILDKAEKYWREVLSLEPEDPSWINNVAWFLFTHDRNINEGMELIEKALKLSPDNIWYLDTKGWGLYKQGKFKEALMIHENIWNLHHEFADTYFRIQEIKKAIANHN